MRCAVYDCVRDNKHDPSLSLDSSHGDKVSSRAVASHPKVNHGLIFFKL